MRLQGQIYRNELSPYPKSDFLIHKSLQPIVADLRITSNYEFC